MNSATNFGRSHGYSENRRLSEDEVRELALRATVQQSKKRERNVKRLFYSVPLLAGLATAVLHKGNSKVLSKEISGVAGKIAEGFKSGGSWAFMLGTGAAIAKTNSMIANKSEGYMDFRRNHPVLSLIGDVGAFIAVSALAPLGLSKLASKMPNKMASLSKGVENLATHINGIKTSKLVTSASEKLSKLIPTKLKNWSATASANMPEGVKAAGNLTKDFGKAVLSWMPHITFFSALFSSLSNRSRFLGDYVKNYETIQKQVNEA